MGRSTGLRLEAGELAAMSDLLNIIARSLSNAYFKSGFHH